MTFIHTWYHIPIMFGKVLKSEKLYLIFGVVALILILFAGLKENTNLKSFFVKVPSTPTPDQGEIISLPNNANITVLVERAKKDLSEMNSVSPSSITVTKTEKKEWPDSSLGCPRAGQMYSQIVTSGYQIVLESKGKTYDYHSDLKEVVLCTR